MCRIDGHTTRRRCMETAIAAFLAPVMKFLVDATGEAAEKAVEKVGSEAWKYATAIWEKLRPKVDEKPAAKEAANDLAANADDEDALASFRLQLRKLLDDQDLAAQVGKLWREAEAANVTTATASGARNIAVGRDATGTFITGDSNKVGD